MAAKDKAADPAAEETTDVAPEPTETPAEVSTPETTPEAPAEAPAADEAAPSVPEGIVNPAEEARKRRDARQQARQERLDEHKAPREDEGRTTSLDTFDNPHEAALAAQATAVDGQGIERIVGPVDTTWKPAPLESTDAEKEAAERRNRMFSKASKQRQEALSNNPEEA